MDEFDRVLACKIAQAETAVAIARLEDQITRLLLTPVCETCCARKGQRCRTRRGYLAAYIHVPRLNALTPGQATRKQRLVLERDRLRREEFERRNST